MKREEFASLLGLGGLIPFIGLALVTTSNDAVRFDWAIKMLVIYAASILTFVGGIHWGALLATPNHRLERHGHLRYLWSVLPSLYACGCALFPPIWALPMLALGLLGAYVVDLYFYRLQGNLNWFVRLRTLLTFVALCSLMFAWWSIRKKLA